ncbi:MAG: DUF6585 family protein [Leptolyngbyaceae cyanobacterium]
MTNSNLHEIASHYRLGNLLETFNWDKKTLRSRAWGSAICTISGLGLMLVVVPMIGSESDLKLILFMIGLTIVAAAVAVFFAIRVWKDLRKINVRAISVFEQGFIDERRRKPEIFLFQDVAKTWHEDVYVRGSGTYSSFSAERQDGSTYKVSSEVEDFHQLRSFIEKSCLQHQLPRMIQIFRNGGDLEFSELRLNQQGVFHKGKQCSWNDLRSVTLNRGAIFLYGENFSRSAIIANIENFCAFLALLEQIKPSLF